MTFDEFLKKRAEFRIQEMEDREKELEKKRERKRAVVRAWYAKNKKSKRIKTNKNELEEKQKKRWEKLTDEQEQEMMDKNFSDYIEISTFAYMVGWTIPRVCAYIAEKKIRVARRKNGDWWIPDSALNGLEIIHPLEFL